MQAVAGACKPVTAIVIPLLHAQYTQKYASDCRYDASISCLQHPEM